MSNAVIEAIKSRRSCRAFKSDAVPKELIEEVIEAGLWAASGMGKQAGAILAVTNPQMREKLRKVNAQIGGWVRHLMEMKLKKVVILRGHFLKKKLK